MELERKKAALVRIAYSVVVALAVFLAIKYLWRLLLPFLAGFLIAYLLRPMVAFLSHHSKIGRRGAAIVSAVVFYIIIGAVCWLLGALCYIQLQNAGAALPGLYSHNLRPILEDLNGSVIRLIGRFSPMVGADSGQVFDSINTALENGFISLSEWLALEVSGVLKSAPLFALTLIFTILSSVLICVDYSDVTSFVLRQIPQRIHITLLEIRDFLAQTILRIVKAYLILMVITFAELTLGLWLLGVECFWVVALVIAVLDLLPVLGSGAVLVPWGIWALISGDYLLGGGLLVLWAVLSFVRQLLEPRIVGNQIGLHPLATLTAMYCGLRLAGFGGLLLAPVICLLVKYLQDHNIVKMYRSA